MVSSWRNERRIHLANRECVWCQGSSHILFHGAPVRIEYREFTFRTWLPREERVTLNTVSTFTTTVACPLILLQKVSRKPLSFLHPLWSQKGKLYDHFTIRLSIRWQITSKFDNVVKGYFQDRRIVFIYIYYMYKDCCWYKVRSDRGYNINITINRVQISRVVNTDQETCEERCE